MLTCPHRGENLVHPRLRTTKTSRTRRQTPYSLIGARKSWELSGYWVLRAVGFLDRKREVDGYDRPYKNRACKGNVQLRLTHDCAKPAGCRSAIYGVFSHTAPASAAGTL